MSESCDVLVVGLGAMGSAAALAAARRGARVLGVDRFATPHALGSSHGRTRIIREAYFEHPCYVPLVQRAYRLWDEIAGAAGMDLMRPTGGAMIGPPEGVLVSGALRSAREHGLPHEVIDAAEIRRRWPVFHPTGDMVAVVEPRAGLLFPERCIEAIRVLASEAGASLRTGVEVTGWRATSGGLVVRTGDGEIRAEHLVLAAGAWMPDLLGDLAVPLSVERQTLAWFEPTARHELFAAGGSPVTIWEHEPDRLFATFPDVGHGVKVMIHHEGEITTPATVRREVTDRDLDALHAILRRIIPELDGRLLGTAVCLYTNTPDHDFVIDRHPADPRVLIASPCSGHGFKFAPVIGEILADLALAGGTAFDLTPFRIGRFAH